MKELLVTVALWLTAGGLPVDTDVEIKYETQREMEIRFYGQPNPETGIQAMYHFDFDKQKGTIYLQPGFDVKDKEHQSTLVHEMVHHHQAVSKKGHKCPDHYEAEAYYVEQVWRHQNKMKPNIHPIRMAHLAMCREKGAWGGE